VILDTDAPRDFHRLGADAWRKSGLGALLALLLLAANVLRPESAVGTSLTDLSLEELHDISVTTAAKHEQPLFVTPAATTVILAEDIRRSGMGSVGDTLRLVPGLNVAEQNAASWAVSSRGFNGGSSSKMLVLVDGRTVLSPYDGSVYWGDADIHMSDLQRIEVVRGSGGTLWGVNAVNGIISVVSRDAAETQGSLISVRGDSIDGLDVYARAGMKTGREAAARVYGRLTDARTELGAEAGGGTLEVTRKRAGFRFDLNRSTAAHTTVQGEFLRQRRTLEGQDPSATGGSASAAVSDHAYLLGRQTRTFSADNQLTVQLYGDLRRGQSVDNSSLSGSGRAGTLDKGYEVDLDLTHAIRVSTSNDLVLGAGVRHSVIDLDSGNTVSGLASRSHRDTGNVFVQDEIALLRKGLLLTLGSKYEFHDHSGGDVLPNARLAWTPSRRQTLWAAVSRAARHPNTSETGAVSSQLPVPSSTGASSGPVSVAGNSAMRSETLNSAELGWRGKPAAQWTLDLVAFLNRYSGLRNLTAASMASGNTAGGGTQSGGAYSIDNSLRAQGEGFEASIDWRPGEDWRFSAYYAYARLHATDGAIESALSSLDLAVPRHTGGIRGWWQACDTLEVAASAYGVSNLAAVAVPGYIRLDLQLIWHPRLDCECALGVQNANDGQHTEYIAGQGFLTAPIRRNVFARITWRF